MVDLNTTLLKHKNKIKSMIIKKKYIKIIIIINIMRIQKKKKTFT